MRYATQITQEFTFHAAHQLRWHPGNCSRLHGHTYRCEVTVEGNVNENGIIIDFDELMTIIDGIIMSKLDHQYLNDIFENPTAEIIAGHILCELVKEGLDVSQVRLWETPESSAIVQRMN